MPNQLSPGVKFTEVDLTTVVPAVASSDGAVSGIYRWGPVGERVLVDNENNLVQMFGAPTNLNPETWFTGANFLGYGNRLYVSRAANTSGSTPSISLKAQTNTTVNSSAVFVPANASINVASLVEQGMYITMSENTSIYTAGSSRSVSSVNSTAIVMSANATTNTAVTLHFGRPGTAYSAVAVEENGVVANLVNQIVKNSGEYTTKDGTFDSDVLYVAKYPGALGNSLRVSVCDTSDSYSSNVNLVGTVNAFAMVGVFSTEIGSRTGTIVVTPGAGGSVAEANTFATTLKNSFSVGDQLLAGNSSVGLQYLQIKSIANASANATVSSVAITFEDPYRLHTAYTANTIQRNWEFFNAVETAPGQSDFVLYNGNTSAQDEMHVVVVDEGGAFTKTPGSILEIYRSVSRATDAKNNDNGGNYYKDLINQNSRYIWFANDRSTALSANALNVASATSSAPGNYTLALGSDGYSEETAPLSVLAAGYDLFAAAEDIDISLVMQGRPTGGTTVVGGKTVSNFQLGNWIIDNILNVRRDCVGFISPDKSLTLNNFGNEALDLVAWRGAIHDSSYAVMDSGYKYQYDRYNDVYRWIPLNGDIAGLCVRTDNTNDAWWSPAGFNRGQIKNLVKLAYNPRESARDILYKNGINPVVTFPGQGTILYGDKTLQAKASAFDRINVRRLFIVLEKAISIAAKYSLFEFNDAFTRTMFKNLVVPYLRNIQGRRGITDFLVVCDDTNNTPQVIDTNQFVGDIYIKPARSINFIQLNFVAVGTGVQFSEVVGRF